jgi:hypothetical protein
VFTNDLSPWVVGFKIIGHGVSFEKQSSGSFVDFARKFIYKLYFSNWALQLRFVCCDG